jgi:hypothetical protein
MHDRAYDAELGQAKCIAPRSSISPDQAARVVAVHHRELDALLNMVIGEYDVAVTYRRPDEILLG